MEVVVVKGSALGETLGAMSRRGVLALGVRRHIFTSLHRMMPSSECFQLMMLDSTERETLNRQGRVKVVLDAYDPRTYWYVEYAGVDHQGNTLCAGVHDFHGLALQRVLEGIGPYLVTKLRAGDAVADLLLATVEPSGRMLVVEDQKRHRHFVQSVSCPRLLPYNGGVIAFKEDTVCLRTAPDQWKPLAEFRAYVVRLSRVRYDGDTYYVLVSLSDETTERMDIQFTADGIRCFRPYPQVRLSGVTALITDAPRTHSITIAVENNVPIVRIRTRGYRGTSRPMRVFTGIDPDAST